MAAKYERMLKDGYETVSIHEVLKDLRYFFPARGRRP